MRYPNARLNSVRIGLDYSSGMMIPFDIRIIPFFYHVQRMIKTWKLSDIARGGASEASLKPPPGATLLLTPTDEECQVFNEST